MRTADVVIIGGGVVGASILHHLASQGVRQAVLLEKGRLASGSTGQSGGFLRVYHPDPVLSDLAAESFPAFLNFEAEVGESCGYVRTGLLYLEPAERAAQMRAGAERLQARGAELEVVEAGALQARFPSLRLEDASCAVYEPQGGYADPVRTTNAWIRSAREAGARAYEGTEVEAILTEKGAVSGVRTNLGTIFTRQVVVAAGAWSGQLLEPLGVQASVRSKRIQIQFHAWPEGTEHPHPAFLDDITDLYARPEPNGVSLIGYPVEEWDFDPDLPVPVQPSSELARLAPSRFPQFAQAQLIGGRRSFDGYTPERRGLLGASEVQGLILATGWSGGGYKLAPAIGRRVAGLLAN